MREREEGKRKGTEKENILLPYSIKYERSRTEGQDSKVVKQMAS